MGVGFGLKTAVEALPGAGAMPDIQAAIDYAAQHGGGKVGIVGFCWGGLLAWRAACSLKGLSAAACYYGGGMTTVAEVARQPQVPVLAHFGQRDHWIRWTACRPLRALTPRCRCMCTTPTTASTATSAGRMTKPRPWWRATAPWLSLQSTWGRAAFSGWPGHRRGVCVAQGCGPGAAGHQPQVTAPQCVPGSVCARTAPPVPWQLPSWSPAPTRIRLACG